MERTLRNRSSGPAARRRLSPVARYAILLFVLVAALVVAVAVTLDRNARRSNWQQNLTALSGAAHVGSSGFDTIRSNLRVEASQLATSLELQRAVLTQNVPRLRAIASGHHARIRLLDRSIGTIPEQPRIASTATITDGVHVLARITIAFPIGREVLTLMRRATPLPRQAGLILVHGGRVVAGGPAGARVLLRRERVRFGGLDFAAQAAPLSVRGASVIAVKPVAAIEAASNRYRRLVFLAAGLTLALAAAFATRLARPLARAMGDVARLSRQAHTDALTGLANRRGLDTRLQVELERASADGTSVSFVIADVDDFKAINDGFGHQTGDAILREVAVALTACVRELDLPARFGGEEFAVILPGSKLADAERTAERMREAVAAIEVPAPEGGLVGTTMSFGVAEFPTYGGVDAVVAAADAALYQAKRRGKNRVAAATVSGEERLVPRDLGASAPA